MSFPQSLRDSWSRFGAAETFAWVTFTLLERLLFLHKLEILLLEPGKVDAKFQGMPALFTGAFLDRDALLALCGPEQGMELDSTFVTSALGKGDRCYAIQKDGEVVSYGWYSRQPTRISSDLLFSFDPDYVYMYKGYTRPAYRGFRLHGVGMSAALRDYAETGCKAIVSYVKRSNLASLRSVYRMGYRKIGSIVFIGQHRRILCWRTRGCKLANVTLQHGALPAAAAPEPYTF